MMKAVFNQSLHSKRQTTFTTKWGNQNMILLSSPVLWWFLDAFQTIVRYFETHTHIWRDSVTGPTPVLVSQFTWRRIPKVFILQFCWLQYVTTNVYMWDIKEKNLLSSNSFWYNRLMVQFHPNTPISILYFFSSYQYRHTMNHGSIH